MKNLKIFGLLLALIVLALVGFFCGGPAQAQTAPDFVALDVGPGVVEFFDTVPGDREFSFIEITAGTSDIGVSIWVGNGPRPAGILKPTFGFAVGDTVIPIASGSSITLSFPGWPKPAFAYVSGGAASFKAE